MAEKDLLEVLTSHFSRIRPFMEADAFASDTYPEDSVRGKLVRLIRVADLYTVFITIMALAMQNSELGVVEALDSMCKTLNVDGEYYFGYAEKTAWMKDHFEKVLGFMDLSY